MRLTPTQKVKTPRKSVSLAQLLRSQSPHQLKEKGEENSNPFEKSEEQDESDSEMIQVRKSAFFKKKQDSYSKISSNKRQKNNLPHENESLNLRIEKRSENHSPRSKTDSKPRHTPQLVADQPDMF